MESYNKKDIRQLLLVAEHYINLAKEMLSSDQNDWFTKKTLDLGRQYSQGYPSQQTKDATIAVAHLASASSRVCTIEETLERKPKSSDYRGKFIKENDIDKICRELKDNIKDYICALLRDNYSHAIYPIKKDYENIEAARREILNELTPKDIGLLVENYFNDYEMELNELLK